MTAVTKQSKQIKTWNFTDMGLKSFFLKKLKAIVPEQRFPELCVLVNDIVKNKNQYLSEDSLKIVAELKESIDKQKNELTNTVGVGKKEINELVEEEVNRPANGPYPFDPFGLNNVMKSGDDALLKTSTKMQMKFVDTYLAIGLSALNDKLIYQTLALIKPEILNSDDFKNKISSAISADIFYWKAQKKLTFSDEMFTYRCQDFLKYLQLPELTKSFVEELKTIVTEKTTNKPN